MPSRRSADSGRSSWQSLFGSSHLGCHHPSPKGKCMPVSNGDTVTRGVRVHVESQFAPEHSDPRQREWFFLYTITISNEGRDTVQLVNRHWVITDAHGKIEEVRG